MRLLTFLLIWLNASKLRWFIAWFFLSLAVDIGNRNHTEDMLVFGNLLSPFAVALVLFALWGLIEVKKSGNILFIISSAPFFMWQLMHYKVNIVFPALVGIFVILKILQKPKKQRL